MSANFMAFCFFAWLAGAILGGVYDGLGVTDTSFNTIVQFDIFKEFEVDLPILSPIKFPVPNLGWFKAVGGLLIWDSSLWAGWANYIRAVLLLSLAFGFIGSLLMTLFSSRVAR